MNLMIRIGLILSAATIAVDHLLYRLPDMVAILLFTAGWILMIAGMIQRRKEP